MKSVSDAAVAGWKWLRRWCQLHATELAGAIGLLLLISVTHYGYDPLALVLFQDTSGAAARALFYVLRGHEGFWLFLAVGVLARSRVLWPVCGFGMGEEAETSICRLADPIAGSVPYEMFSGLCGEKAYAAGIAVAAGLALALIRRKR